MSPALLAAVALASLVGSLHCAGMCGGFVAIYSVGSRRALSHLAYHLGRLITYVALGSAAGALGAALDLAGKAAGIGRVAGVIAGTLMVLWALASLLEVGGLRLKSPRVVRLLTRITDKPPLVRALLIGLSSTLLPCGWLYAFAVAAAGTGSTLGGALVMAAFWAGSVPMLLGLGLALGSIAPRLRRHVPVLSAALLLLVGLSSLITRWNLPALAASEVAHRAAGEQPACHHEP